MLQGFDQIGRLPRISPLVDRKMAGWGLSNQSMDLTKTNYLEGAAMPWPTSLSTRALPWSNALPPPPPRSQSTPPFQGPAQMRTSQNPNPKTQLRLGMSLENSKYWRAESNESQVTAHLSCRVCTTRSLLLLPLCCSYTHTARLLPAVGSGVVGAVFGPPCRNPRSSFNLNGPARSNSLL